MKPGLKATVILIVTLALGIALGFVGHGTWQHYRWEHRERLPRTGGFVERMERILQPDSMYVDTVKAVLEQHAERFHELNVEQHEAMQTLMDTLIINLQGLVPADRLEELKQIRDRGGFRRDHHRSERYRR